MKQKEMYKIFGYHDVDGGIAAAICLRHLHDMAKCSSTQYTTIEFEIEPVSRSSAKNQSIAEILRKNYIKFGISKKIIEDYDDFIDLAALVQKKEYLLSKKNDCLFSPAAKLHDLFHPTHSAIDSKLLYKLLVCQISKNSCVEDIFDYQLIS